MEKNLSKILIAVALILLALVSVLLIADKAASLQENASTISALDEKVETVLKLTATSSLASAGISMLPGDAATPIAEKLADFTEYFLLILCVLYAEKYLVTIIASVAFKILIPCACLALIISLFWNKKTMQRLGLKLAVFGLAIFIAIPLSIRVSDAIYGTYEASLNNTITAAEDFTDEASDVSEAENQGVLAQFLESVSESVSSLSDKAAKTLNRFVESLAVMIVTSCVIPILVLLFFLWLIKAFLGAKVTLPVPHGKKDEKKPHDAEE